MTQAYPLHWPENWPRTAAKSTSRFKTSISGALNNVQDSIRKFATDTGKRVENIVISSNVTIGEQRPKDPGVAVYFSWNGISTCIAVDLYNYVEDNLQAIHHCIEAERTKMRHGGLHLVQAAFRGYAALPPPSGPRKDWWDTLQCKRDTPLATVEAQYKRLARDYHPDKGGSADKMAEINTAIAQARREKGETV